MLLSLLKPETFPAAIDRLRESYTQAVWFTDGQTFPLPFGKDLKRFFELPKNGETPFTGVESGKNAGNYHHFINTTAATAHFIHYYAKKGEFDASDTLRTLTLLVAAYYHDVGKTVVDRRHAIEGRAFFEEPKASTQYQFSRIFAHYGQPLDGDTLRRIAVFVGAHDVCGTLSTGENSLRGLGRVLSDFAAVHANLPPAEKANNLKADLFDLWLLNRADILVSLANKWQSQDVCHLPPGDYDAQLETYLNSAKGRALDEDYVVALAAVDELCAGRDTDAFLATAAAHNATRRIARIASQTLIDVLPSSTQIPPALVDAIRTRLNAPGLAAQINSVFRAELGSGWETALADIGQLDYALGFFLKLARRLCVWLGRELSGTPDAVRTGWLYFRKDRTKPDYDQDYLDHYNAECIVSNWLVVLAGITGAICRLTSGIGLWNIEFCDANDRLNDSKLDKLLLLDGPHRAATTRDLLIREIMFYKS